MKEEAVKPLDLISAEVGSLTKILRLMGLSKREIEVYLLLQANGPSTAREVAQGLDIPYSKAYESLSRLMKLGWVLRAEGRPHKFFPVNIREIWQEAKKEIEAKMSDVEERVIPVIEKLATTPSPLFKILLLGEEDVFRFFNKMIDARGKNLSLAIAHRELLTMQSIQRISGVWGASARLLVTKEVLDTSELKRFSREVKVRVIKEMFGSGVIGDGIMLVIRNGGRLNALWSDHAYFVDLGKVYFEYLWEQSKEIEQ
jgi:sugar-specific transcriptional regulator TrmB|uniref:TrmB family transcriptional regulator n=1 Tax=Fervidicoccus fontis TaxID=683846 RepID=A0A7J3SJN0_9CREN